MRERRTRNQMFNPGELPLVLLVLLERRPCNGHELLAELGRLFGPAYKPSPGGVYPAVAALEAEGLIERTSEGRPSTYGVTRAGRRTLASRSDLIATLENRHGVRLRGQSLATVLDRFAARVLACDGRVDDGEVERMLDEVAIKVEALASVDEGVDR